MDTLPSFFVRNRLFNISDFDTTRCFCIKIHTIYQTSDKNNVFKIFCNLQTASRSFLYRNSSISTGKIDTLSRKIIWTIFENSSPSRSEKHQRLPRDDPNRLFRITIDLYPRSFELDVPGQAGRLIISVSSDDTSKGFVPNLNNLED